ncbi:hypothetical protein ACGFIV_32600 [Sphaerisporangium sp. NPDC049003]|uniref:hypothetical protein n=1 Tax=Sphaerisporangium sp. NPDC049003 TaxID=3364517 RepID=UPI00371D3F74
MTELLPSGADLLATGLTVLRAHQERSLATISLIAAENAMVPFARLPLICDLYNRYMFEQDPDPAAGGWNFPSAKSAAWLETGLAVPLLRRLAGAEHVNVRPLSGLHAMEMVITALGGQSGETVACIATGQGGHYATADVARRLGHPVVHLPGCGPHELDLEQLAEVCEMYRPSLIYLDQCHALDPVDTARVVTAVKQVSPATHVHVDISHPLGLVLGGALPNPLAEGADSMSASTHKTFPGPQKGIIATRDASVHAKIQAVQPQLVSNHHIGAVAALGLSLAAFADQAGAYAHAVVATARSLGKELAHAGWEVAGAEFGYTRTHQLWVTTPRLAAREAAERLYAAGIHVNWLSDLPLKQPALRLGLAEAAWTGLTPADMPRLAAIMTSAVEGERPPVDLARQTAELRSTLAYPFAPALTRDAVGDASWTAASFVGQIA